MTHPLTLPQAVRLLRAQGDDQHAQVLEDMLDSMPFGDYEAERNQEPLDGESLDRLAEELPPRGAYETTCSHPWVLTVCANPLCGLVIGLPRMHPEES